MKCTICGEEVQTHDIGRKGLTVSQDNPVDNGISELVELLKQHSVTVTCICQGGIGHVYRLPTADVGVQSLAEVQQVVNLLQKHGVRSFNTRVSLSGGRVVTCKIELREKRKEPLKTEKLIVSAGSPIPME